ncbi:MAG: hypothetical protein ACQ5SW_01770 [Sphaerochaetaceae bacterium]
MRYSLCLLFLFVFLSPLSSAALDFSHDPDVPTEVMEGVQHALTASLLERLPEQGVLNAVLQREEQQEGFSLSLQYGEAQLNYMLLGNPEGYEKRLRSALDYDGLSLLGALPPFGLTFSFGRGYGTRTNDSPYKEGDRFSVLDAQQRYQGMVILNHVDEEEGLLFFSQISGKPLYLGMELKEQGNKGVSVSLSFTRELSPSVDLLASLPLPLYPFSFRFGLGTTAADWFYGSVGLSATFPFSQLFSSRSYLVRNVSLDAAALFSVGYGTSIDDIAYQASGEIGLTCNFGNWALSLSLGNRVAASDAILLEQGLFLKLGTAYTYTL